MLRWVCAGRHAARDEELSSVAGSSDQARGRGELLEEREIAVIHREHSTTDPEMLMILHDKDEDAGEVPALGQEA